MKLIRVMNHYFIHDPEETATISDYMFWYVTLSFMFVFSLIMIVKLFIL